MPPPDVMDQAAVVALPPKLAPARVIAVGFADWHTTSVLPAFTVGAWLTVIVRVALTAGHDPGALVVRVSVTVPEKFASGV